MFSDSVPVLPLPGRPPSTDAFIEALKYGDFKWAFLLPVIIDQLSQDSDALDLVAKKLQYLFYTGGALPEEAGQVVSSKIPVFSGLGSSEASALPQVLSCDLPDSETWRESWQYIHIHPSAGPEFRKCMDNLYELVIIKSKEHAEAQPVFAMFPELSEYSTRDLFTPHPNTRNLWRHCGRRDDIVVFLNGEKTNPISFEDHVSRHPAVRAALVAGNQRFEACLLVEPAAENLSDTAKANLIEAIWPTVEEANRQCPAHARVFKTKILVLDSDKPMLRAGKGTVQRAGTVQLYAKQIDALYSDSESATHESKPNVSISSLEDALNALRPLVLEITGWSVPDDVDFSALGMDSLHVLRLSAAIASEFGIPMSPAVIYKNPTIEFLARQVYPHGTASNEYDRIETMTQLLQRYEKQIDQLATQSAKVSNNVEASHVVILTGSTGTVGSFLLDRLVSSADISHIYCLNRAPDSRCLQVARNQRRAIPCDFPAEKVTFLTVDLAKDRFSLDEATYDTLLNHTTQIIHNAWPVDFNQPLQFFEASLDGLLSLVAFTTKAKLNPTLLFLSSVSSVSSYETIPNHSAPVPETTIMDPSCTAPIGYGESKYVGERIMHYASTKIPRSFGVCRVDQVAGTAQNPRGWNKHEWLPSLIISSRYLQALPRSLSANNEDIITWIPVDELVSILIELSSSLATSIDPELTGPTGQLQVFHCANRNFADWQRHLVPVVQEELKMDLSSDEEKCLKRPELIDFDAWLSVLRDTIVREGANLDIEKVPAAKLVDFYGQLLASPPPADRMTLSVDKTLESSKTLRELQQIQPEWVRGWIREWLR